MPNNVRNPQIGAPSYVFIMNSFSNAVSIDTLSSLTVTYDTPSAVLFDSSVRSASTVNNAVTFTLSF